MVKADRPFSWLNPLPRIKSRNDRLVRRFHDPTNERRRAWVGEIAPEGSDFIVDRSNPAQGEISFLVAGDTGEGDDSQFVTVIPEQNEAGDTDFLFICSDVIYPAGGINDYMEKFFRPYQRYRRDIYAVPGNHDWYDDCTGFMFWFCGRNQAPRWPRPEQKLLVALAASGDGQLARQLPAGPGRLRCGCSCGGRPRLRSSGPLSSDWNWQKGGPPADRPQLGLLAKLLLGHAGVPRQAAGDRTDAGQPAGDSAVLGQPAAEPRLFRTDDVTAVSVGGGWH